MSVYRIHGILQAIAFLFLFPLGALIAVARFHLGPWWLKAHVTVQFLATLLVAVAVSLVWTPKRAPHTPHTPHTPSPIVRKHHAIGKALLILIALQWIWALVGRRWIPWNAWLAVHAILATCILGLGFYQVYLGATMTKN
jgi:hypothetical protein